MWWWKTLLLRHERWLKAFWRTRRVSRWHDLQDLVYRTGWGIFLYVLGMLQAPEGSFVAATLLVLLHPVAPWWWKGGWVMGCTLLAYINPVLAMSVAVAGLVWFEALLFQTYEFLLFFPLWGIWAWLDTYRYPTADRWLLAFWVALAYGWAHKLAEPPLGVLLKDETFQAWLHDEEQEA